MSVRIDRMKTYKNRPEISAFARQELREYSDFVSHLLFHRGIDTKEKADYFFKYTYQDLHDPSLLKDMDKAVERILKAIDGNELITIYSDYDADGIPAAVILSDFFDKINYKNYNVYIPHRNREGFGLNIKAIDSFIEKNTKLLITLDCGIADVEQVNYANENNIDVIIVDHHETNGIVPDAHAVINPKQEDCEYPEKMLCGSGVTFKLVQALLATNKFAVPENWEKTLLDMVGIATLSDMVPLLGENRSLANFGLTVLRMSPRKGLNMLLRKSCIKQENISEDDVGFSISPKINAASRMGEPELAFKMLKSRDHSEAGALVDHLHKINDERKGHVAAIIKEIKHRKEVLEKPGILVTGNVNWQPSLLGLAANTLCEEFSRPVFLWGRGDGSDLKGSCRSPHVSVVDLLSKLPDSVLETWGGHHLAGGFVVKSEAVDFLYDELMKNYSNIENASSVEVFVDYVLNLNEINFSLWKDLLKLSPFGQDNPKPLIMINNIFIKEFKLFGKRKEHLSLVVSDGKNQKEAIAFFKGLDSWQKNIQEKENISLLANIEKNTFGGANNLRLKIVDIL